MSRRTVEVLQYAGHAHVARITYESDLREYRVRIDNDPKSDYFTDTDIDARVTGWAMLSHAHELDQKENA
jgi:hypothetical protein